MNKSVFIIISMTLVFSSTIYSGQNKGKEKSKGDHIAQLKEILYVKGFTLNASNGYEWCTHPHFTGTYNDNISLQTLLSPLSGVDVAQTKEELSRQFRFIFTPQTDYLVVFTTALALQLKKKKIGALVCKLAILKNLKFLNKIEHKVILYPSNKPGDAQKLLLKLIKLKTKSPVSTFTPLHAQKINELLYIMQGDNTERYLAYETNCFAEYFTTEGAYYNPDFMGVASPFLTDKDGKPF